MFGFSLNALRKIKRSVMRDEREPLNHEQHRAGRAYGQGANIQFVELNNTILTSGRYAGKIKQRDITAKTWSDLTANDIWIDPDGQTLETGKQYPAKFMGVLAADSKAVFMVDESSGGAITVEESDGTPSVSVVTKIKIDQASKLKLTDNTGGVVTIAADGVTDTFTVVTAVSCSGGTLSVTSQTASFTKGLLDAAVP